MIRLFTGALAAALLVAIATTAHAELQRLYVLDCGTNLGKDQSRWSPGVNEGKPIEFSDNCYLIRHSKGLLLWDTGISDAVAAMPNGLVTANGAIIQSRAKTLAAQLTELGVKPADVTYVAVSHTHGDHVGNIGQFPTSTVLIQGAEYDWAMAGQNKPAFVDSQKIQKLAGDHDVFGDGSVTIITTPGHTPGHQSVLVEGDVLIAADACYFPSTVDDERFPSYGWDRDSERESLAWIREQRDSGLTVLYGHEPSAGTFQRA